MEALIFDLTNMCFQSNNKGSEENDSDVWMLSHFNTYYTIDLESCISFLRGLILSWWKSNGYFRQCLACLLDIFMSE